MNASALNLEAIVRAKHQHDLKCWEPAHTVVLNPFDVERLGWEVGDPIAGLTVDVDASIGTGRFELLCDRDRPAAGEDAEARETARDGELVPA